MVLVPVSGHAPQPLNVKLNSSDAVARVRQYRAVGRVWAKIRPGIVAEAGMPPSAAAAGSRGSGVTRTQRIH
jgi:hypothetical protein